MLDSRVGGEHDEHAHCEDVCAPKNIKNRNTQHKMDAALVILATNNSCQTANKNKPWADRAPVIQTRSKAHHLKNRLQKFSSHSFFLGGGLFLNTCFSCAPSPLLSTLSLSLFLNLSLSLFLPLSYSLNASSFLTQYRC